MDEEQVKNSPVPAGLINIYNNITITLLAARSKRKFMRMRILLITTIPRLSLLFGSVLMLLAMVAILSGSFFDLDGLTSRSHVALLNPHHNNQAEGNPSSSDIWSSKLSKFYYGCSNPSHPYATAGPYSHPKRYLMIAASGGLNQQRTGITDAVVVARMLNATLVVPKLDQKSFWKDKSDFGDIFDVEWFINSLSRDVLIVNEVPPKLKPGRLYSMRVPRKCTPHCYETRVLPVLNKKHVVQLTKFDYRLANKLQNDLQKLRCKVNYHALRFTKSINDMGQLLVERMRHKSKRFIALHLRFEPDMLAFSGCYFGGGDIERKELGAIRKRWKSLHVSNPEKERRHGKCPLTPQEVGLMLRALGFGKDVYLYVASGEVYGGEESLAPLKSMFPNFYTKDTLATKDELEAFSSYSSRMAALDYIVCDESDVFVTNNNGNMAKMLAGRRRYFGHKRTIRPNSKKLYSLFLNRQNMTWNDFQMKVHTYQKGFMGEPNEVKPGRGEFHEFPLACICEQPNAKGKIESIFQSETKPKTKSPGNLQHSNEIARTEYETGSDDVDWMGKDDTEENLQAQQVDLEDEPEIEEVISD